MQKMRKSASAPSQLCDLYKRDPSSSKHDVSVRSIPSSYDVKNIETFIQAPISHHVSCQLNGELYKNEEEKMYEYIACVSSPPDLKDYQKVKAPKISLKNKIMRILRSFRYMRNFRSMRRK